VQVCIKAVVAVTTLGIFAVGGAFALFLPA
jgi:hypothetical protein